MSRTQSAGSADRLRVIHVTELPQGWLGKHHAMHLAAAAADTDWLCFTDADCRFTSPRAVTAAVCEAVAHEADLLTVTPELETRETWERILQPVCAAVLILWFQPDRVNDPRRRTAYANGAFMLMSRRCYDAIGGHEAVRQCLNEDIPMARRVKQAGLRLWMTPNDGLYTTRMYATPRQAWRGWSRIFCGALLTRPRIALAMGFLSFFTLLPWVSLAVSLAGWAIGGTEDAAFWRGAAALWAAVAAAQLWSIRRWYAIAKFGGRWSWTYVLGATWTLGMLADAFLKAGGVRTTEWRGSRYRRGVRQVPGAAPAPAVPVGPMAPVAAGAAVIAASLAPALKEPAVEA